MILKLEGFMHVSSIDLNMGYFYVALSPVEEQLCTIVLPWGKNEYQKLPMGVCNRTDIFQDKISEVFDGLDKVRVYIDNVIVIQYIFYR